MAACSHREALAPRRLVQHGEVVVPRRNTGLGVHPCRWPGVGERHGAHFVPPHVKSVRAGRGLGELRVVRTEHGLPRLGPAWVEVAAEAGGRRLSTLVRDSALGEARARARLHVAPDRRVVDEWCLAARQRLAALVEVVHLVREEHDFPRRVGEEAHLAVLGHWQHRRELGGREDGGRVLHRQARRGAKVDVLKVGVDGGGDALKVGRVGEEGEAAEQHGAVRPQRLFEWRVPRLHPRHQLFGRRERRGLEVARAD
mmetsp:Transcript_37962/g.65492  ORF Transcript_37962/g.65492 Transcript_37962/m.65492 type:complete len:256 (+) Transcript_37962:384-1151(+)